MILVIAFTGEKNIKDAIDEHLLENTDLSPSRFHFSVGSISRSNFFTYNLYFEHISVLTLKMSVRTHGRDLFGTIIKQYLVLGTDKGAHVRL